MQMSFSNLTTSVKPTTKKIDFSPVDRSYTMTMNNKMNNMKLQDCDSVNRINVRLSRVNIEDGKVVLRFDNYGLIPILPSDYEEYIDGEHCWNKQLMLLQRAVGYDFDRNIPYKNIVSRYVDSDWFMIDVIVDVSEGEWSYVSGIKDTIEECFYKNCDSWIFTEI